MQIRYFLKILATFLVFLVLGWIEGTLTHPQSPSELEYQKYYEEQSKKPYLSEEELAKLQRKADELLQASPDDVPPLLQRKAVFALIVLIAAFISSKYILVELRTWASVVAILVCGVSLFWFVSGLEFVTYMMFCAIGAFVGQKFNKSSKRTAKDAPA